MVNIEEIIKNLPKQEDGKIQIKADFLKKLIDMAYRNGVEIAASSDDSISTDWRDKLYEDLFYGRRQFREFPYDFAESVDYAIDTLTPREKHIILSRYENQLGFNAIAEEMELPCQRVRQIFAKAKRKLRHKSRAIYFQEGMASVKAKQEEEITGNLKFPPNTKKIDILDIDLDLSPRALNCLASVGIQNRDDLVNFVVLNGGIESILKIRNCGEKTYKEIVEKVYFNNKTESVTKKECEKCEANNSIDRLKRQYNIDDRFESIFDYELSYRAANCLVRYDLYTRDDVVSYCAKYATLQEGLSRIRGMGIKTMEEIILKLKL